MHCSIEAWWALARLANLCRIIAMCYRTRSRFVLKLYDLWLHVQALARSRSPAAECQLWPAYMTDERCM